MWGLLIGMVIASALMASTLATRSAHAEGVEAGRFRRWSSLPLGPVRRRRTGRSVARGV